MERTWKNMAYLEHEYESEASREHVPELQVDVVGLRMTGRVPEEKTNLL